MGARREISGSDIVLAIDPDGGNNYNLVVCLTSNSLELTSNEIDASSKCGPSTLPGSQKASVPFEFQDVWDANNGEISSGLLFPLWRDRTLVTWMFGTLNAISGTPDEGDETYTGSGYILQLNKTAGKDSPVTTSAVLSVTGVPTLTVTGS